MNFDASRWFGFQPTYEELKRSLLKRAGAYWERFQPTYEELKH